MKIITSRNKWIEVGYFLFAENGPQNFSIKKLSEIAGLPRTNFYYHFNDYNELFEEIIKLHFGVTDEYLRIITDELKNFLPDLHIISVRYPLGLKFVKQLFLNRDTKKYNELYIELNHMTFPVIIPKMLEYYNLKIDYHIAKNLWVTVLDTWYSQLDVDNINLENLCQSTDRIMKTVIDFSID